MTQTIPNQSSPLDDEPWFTRVTQLIEAGETNSSIVRILAAEQGPLTTKDSVRRFRKRHALQVPGAEGGGAYTRVAGDNAEGQTVPRQSVRGIHDKPILDDPDTMLQERGLDPEEWYIAEDGITVNQWDGPHVDGNVVTYYQAKFRAKRKRPELTLRPVRSDGWVRPTSRWRKPSKGAPQLVVICGDQQAPFHDPHLHTLFCRFLADVQPHRGINLGDLMDFPDISRHKGDPENLAIANECLQSGYDLFRGYVDASPETDWEWLPGNHDIRLRDYEIANAPLIYGLKRVDTPEGRGAIAHSIEHLMRLDELGVKWVDPHGGSYEDAQVVLSPNLAVRHGWIVRQGSGASALKTLETTGYSIIIGHTHRQSMVYHTFHEIDGTPRQLLAAEAGCMCRMDARDQFDDRGRRYPAYTTNPNWQPGFATAAIYPDGKFKVDLGTYVNGTLLWRDRRYEWDRRYE